MTKVTFKSTDNLMLAGLWHYSKKKSPKVIILAHGITVDKDEGGVFVGLAGNVEFF